MQSIILFSAITFLNLSLKIIKLDFCECNQQIFPLFLHLKTYKSGCKPAEVASVLHPDDIILKSFQSLY